MLGTLERVALLGVRGLLAPLPLEDGERRAAALLSTLETAFVVLAERLSRADALRTRARASAGRAEVDALLGAGQALLGAGAKAIPRFTLKNRSELERAAREPLLAEPSLALREWLTGVAPTRAAAAALARVFLLGELYGEPSPSGRPLQLPVEDGDFWLGAEFPTERDASGAERRRRPTRDKLSLVVFEASALTLDADAAAACVLVDQWNEIIANETETTGIAVHYDQPDATAPQSLLLAVPPRVRGRWRWEDLVHTLDDTLELAKNRTVELEHLNQDIYGQLLPAVTGEAVPSATEGVSELDGGRVILDFGVNNLPAAE